MQSISRLVPMLLCLFLTPVFTAGQNIEAGLHTGVAGINGRTPDRTETTGAFGIWVGLWPTEKLAFNFDWSYLPLEDFETLMGNIPFGERDRNRQYVDVTLQYHLIRLNRFSAFLAAGGGSHWDNRDIFNPTGSPEIEEGGKESTKTGIWTLGAGLRTRLFPHLNWINEIKVHNPGSREKEGVRFLTGLTLSWK